MHKNPTYLLILVIIFACSCERKNNSSYNSDSDTTKTKADTVGQNISVTDCTADKIVGIKYCDFNGTDLYFDAVPDIKTAKQKLKDDPSIEYYLQNEAFHVFQKVRMDILRRKALAKKLGLSAQAIIAEQQTVPGYANRAFILWVDSGRVAFNSDELYSCPQVTTGTGFFQGRTRVSLIDTKKQEIINTIPIYGSSWDENIYDCFTIPFCIANPRYRSELGQLKYHASGGDSIKDGRAQVLYLDDYNGDGKKHEFALYEQLGCVSCNSTLFGYDEKNDCLINYTVVLEETDLDSAQNAPYTTESYWVSQMFTLKPRKGKYDFLMDYRGRGGHLCFYNVIFNKDNNRFEGTVKFTAQENDSIGYSWISYPEQK